MIVASNIAFRPLARIGEAIDRIAREGLLFTDHYAQPTCTPGRKIVYGPTVQ